MRSYRSRLSQRLTRTEHRQGGFHLRPCACGARPDRPPPPPSPNDTIDIEFSEVIVGLIHDRDVDPDLLLHPARSLALP